MEELSNVTAVREITGADELMLWTYGEAITSQPRAWASHDRSAVVVAAADRSGRDRLGLWGAVESLAPLAQKARRIVGPTYRPIGSPHLVEALIEHDRDLIRVPPFCWMQTRRAPTDRTPHSGLVNLDRSDDDLIRDLLSEEFSSSHAMPGIAGVECWVGIRSNDGRLDAVGALAWSCPDVGFLSGIAVRRSATGHGLGQSITRHLIDRSLKQRPVAALMVDAENERGRGLYSRAGMSIRLLGAAFSVDAQS